MKYSVTAKAIRRDGIPATEIIECDGFRVGESGVTFYRSKSARGEGYKITDIAFFPHRELYRIGEAVDAPNE